MLEDSTTMEKKPSNRPTQNPSKGTELKRPQDSASKSFPKSSRKREPPNSNGSRLDQGRKPAPQKTKTLDKRPRPRGQYYGGGKESAQVEECSAELGSLYSTGSKKQNLNHLLNFHYAPRGETARQAPRPSYQYGVKWLMTTQKHKYNKEHFLQANCQFVVREDADYNPCLADPDHLVDWDFIEQIKVSSVEPVSCPICLSAPVAGKMTRCGHIYCCPCILHYLALSDKTWRKCPICYEAVHKNDLKSVKVESKTGYNLGEPITFSLMKRERGSLMACPVSQFDLRSRQKLVLNVSEKHLDTAFAKLLTADKQEVLHMINEEVKELEAEKADNEGCPEICFIEQALEMCSQRKLNIEQNKTEVKEAVKIPVRIESLKKEPSSDTDQFSSSPENNVVYDSAFDNITFDPNQNANTAVTKNEADNPNQNANTAVAKIEADDPNQNANTAVGKLEAELENSPGSENNNRQRYESVSSEGEDSSPTTITAEDLEVFSHNQPNTSNAKHFYFYQASDGQQIYLHAVNVQMLEMTYGSLCDSPHSLCGVIVEREAGSMTTELRRRLRYLQHLPVTAQFDVMEIELRPPTVTHDTLDAFRGQLELRKKRRQKRARDERKREKKIEEVELRQMGRHRAPRLRLDSFHHFPQCGIAEDEIPPPSAPRALSAESSRASSPSSRRSASPAVAALALEQDPSCPSFAQMLRNKKGASGGGGGGSRGGVGWGRSRVCPPSPPRQLETVDSDGETASAPRYRQTFSDAITAALQNASISQEQNDGVQGGKKKKKKQKVLFSTGMACTSK